MSSWLIWGVLLPAIASSAFSARSATSDESREWSDRRDIHAELPADVNLQDVLHARAEPEANSIAMDLETPCPCRIITTEEDVDEGASPHPIGLIGLGFGSAVLVFLVALVAWQTYATRDSGRP